MEPVDELERLEPGSPLALVIEAVRLEMQERGEATLPRLEGVDGMTFVRWLYRTHLEQHQRWMPLLLVDPVHLEAGPEGDAGGWAVARGGWVYLGPTPPAAIPAGLRAEARAGRLQLLVQGDGPPLAVPPGWRSQLLRLEPFHAVASDPGLALLRRSILSHCRSLSPVLLTGEQGTGKALLARWAHARLDARPLSHIRGETGRPQPGEWALFEEVGGLAADQRHLLEERLRELETPPPLSRPLPSRHRPDHPALEAIAGESPALAEVLEQAITLAPSRLPILITGEPGVGKEALARALHTLSGRRGAFVALDMGALTESLAESALFGHRRGAFTGAERHRLGAFRSADGGTLFLDELGNLAPALQTRLLRVLQEGEVLPLGDDVPVKVEVRVIAATNADLEAQVRRGCFRADLLGRLNAATLHVPPLRDRLEDLDALARHFLRLERGAPPPEPWCTPAARSALLDYRWPGNVRELSNIVRYAAAVAPPGIAIDAAHLGPLSPWNRRRTPLITTSSHSGQHDGWGMDRHLVQRLTATTLTVPPFRDRGVDSRRHAILHLLSGRQIGPAALRLLEAQPWWGNLTELEATLAALRALPPGPIDVHRLETYLPHVAVPAGLAPIRVLLSPSRGADGRIDGLTRDFSAGALLVGRVRELEELRRAGRAGDRRIALWLEQLRTLCGAAEPECLELGLLNRLSRAHFLITRAGTGFRAHGLPAVGLPVLAGPLEPVGAPMRPLVPDRPIDLGRAGEVQVLGPDERPYLRLFVFAGTVAVEEFGGLALARVEAPAGMSPPTMVHSLVRPGVERLPTPPVEAVAPGLRVWAVDAREEAALTEILIGFRGGQLKAHIARVLPAYRDPVYGRLSDYLERAPRLSQYLVRLYEHPENAGLRRRLRERLAGEPDREIRLALLPEGLRRCLEEE